MNFGTPQLNSLTEATGAAKLLESVLIDHPQPWMNDCFGSLVIQAVTLLRGHADSRWTLRYVVRWGKEERTLIAKFYVRDRSDVARLLSEISKSGLGSNQTMQIPTLVAYVDELRLLIMEEVAGDSVRTLLRQGQAGVGEKAARWLAAFHASPIPLPANVRLLCPVVRARRWAQALTVNVPCLNLRSSRLLDVLIRAKPPWPPALYVTHGDFGISHMYVSESVTSVIDWDAWGVGDCAEDAGRFLASLYHFIARDPERNQGALLEAQEFTRSFQERVPLSQHSLSFYEALACLRTAARVSVNCNPRRVRYAENLLSHAEQALKNEMSSMIN